MARIPLRLMIVLLAAVLASCGQTRSAGVVLESSDETGDRGASDWERFIKVVESIATSAGLVPQRDVTNHVCRSWSTDTSGSNGRLGADGLVVTACRERDFRGTHLPTGAIVLWNSNWWNPFAASRATTMRSDLIGALHAEFGDRIKAAP